MELTRNETDRILDALLEALRPSIGDRRALVATWRRHSNEVGRIALDDGRVLMLKVGRFEWAGPRFRAERRAARRLREHGIVAPLHLDAPEEVLGRPVLAYWRIDLPTLATVWPDADDAVRRSALRDWGALLRRMHAVPVDGCGPLADPEPRHDPIDDYIAPDLEERLRPAIEGAWPEGVAPLEAALAALPLLRERIGGSPAVLLHGDPHAGNVMCRPANGASPGRCEGVIDLEAVAGGPRELDLAHALVLHGPLFAQPLPDGWFEELRHGYGIDPDPFALRWCAVYHLLNLGFFSALVGDHEHAAAVAEAAAERARGLDG